MNVLKDVLKTVGYAIVFIGGIVLAFCITIIFGYFIGGVLASLPIISDWLMLSGSVDKSQIPTITAWIAVIGSFVGLGRGASERN